MNWECVLSMLGGMLALFGVFSGLMLWMMSRMENRLHTDIAATAEQFSAMTARIDATNLRLDANFSAMSARLDANSARLDSNQAAIMRLMEKITKTD